jgi:NADPH2 dehydrogenase
MVGLFDILTLRGLALRNRIMFSPMSQNSAGRDGRITTWHVVHYGSRAVGGAGLIMLEDTAVEPRGRLGSSALGIYDDAQAQALEELVRFCQEHGAAVGVQLGHAGRKAFAATRGQADSIPLGPTAEPFDEGWVAPSAATEQDMDDVVEAYKAAAQRCAQVGVDVVEVHAAHGYLLHSFLSPLSNTRVDGYGGSSEGPQRLLLRVVAALRDVWPEDRPICVRVSASDEASGGLEPEDLLGLMPALREHGVDLIVASSGGLLPG